VLETTSSLNQLNSALVEELESKVQATYSTFMLEAIFRTCHAFNIVASCHVEGLSPWISYSPGVMDFGSISRLRSPANRITHVEHRPCTKESELFRKAYSQGNATILTHFLHLGKEPCWCLSGLHLFATSEDRNPEWRLFLHSL
jgi:hypothetical protein